MRTTAAALLLLAGCASAQLRKDQSVCPEFRDLRCMSAPECSFDKGRGCFVCQCQPTGADKADSALPSGIPPDRRP